MLVWDTSIDILVFRESSIDHIFPFINYIFQVLTIMLTQRLQHILPCTITIIIKLRWHFALFPWQQLILSLVLIIILLRLFHTLNWSHKTWHWYLNQHSWSVFLLILLSIFLIFLFFWFGLSLDIPSQVFPLHLGVLIHVLNFHAFTDETNPLLQL